MGSHPESLWNALVFITLVGQIGYLSRSAYIKTIGRYPAITLWATVSAIKSVLLFALPYQYALNSPTYAAAWSWANIATTICLVLAAREIFRRTMEHYPTAGTYGRKVFWCSAAVGIAIGLLPFSIDTITRRVTQINWTAMVSTRTALIAVALGLTASVLHLRRVRTPERRNVIINRTLMIILCAGQSLGLSAVLYTRDFTWTTAYLAAAAICWLIWPWLLSEKGEEVYRVDPSAEEKSDIERRWNGFKRVLHLKPGREIPARALRQSEQES